GGTLRAGFPGTTVSLASTTPGVGTIVAPTVPFAAGDSCQSTAAFHPAGAGMTTLRITGTPSGFATPADSQQITATVTGPVLFLGVGSPLLGKNLETSGSVSLEVAAPAGGVSITVTSADESRVLLSTDFTAPGTKSITLPVAEGAASANFYIHALQASGGGPITATEATSRYTPAAPATVTLVPSGFIISGSDFSTTTQSADTTLSVCVVQLDPTTLNTTAGGTLRAGFPGTTVSLASTTPGVGTIVAPTVPFAAGDSC